MLHSLQKEALPCPGSKTQYFSKDMACSGNEEKNIEILLKPLVVISDSFLLSKFSFKLLCIIYFFIDMSCISSILNTECKG